MDEFEAIANATVNEEFVRLTKAADSLTDEEQKAYANKFPIRIWMVAGPSEDLSFAISVN